MEPRFSSDLPAQLELEEDALSLLGQLISIPSFSKEEHGTADAIQQFLEDKGISVHRKMNNIWAFNKHYDSDLPTILLNSHHDTVKPNSGYTRNPFETEVLDGKMFGLGSNDAGGALVALIAAFRYFYSCSGMKYNLVLAATAEEEISGNNGIECILPELGKISVALVGEPTGMELAVAEKGLLVIDCIAKGKSGHAAREEGENAIYYAMQDIAWFKTFRFPKVSPYLGEVKMSVTLIEAGAQHNVIPAECYYTVDIRLNELYTHEEVLKEIRARVNSVICPRSTRLRSSSIPIDHPLVQAGLQLGRKTYGSPTSSDMALLSVPALKMGPGNSVRSHAADEYIGVAELREGIQLYTALLRRIV